MYFAIFSNDGGTSSNFYRQASAAHKLKSCKVIFPLKTPPTASPFFQDQNNTSKFAFSFWNSPFKGLCNDMLINNQEFDKGRKRFMQPFYQNEKQQT
jgi:hypothetical protein